MQKKHSSTSTLRTSKSKTYQLYSCIVLAILVLTLSFSTSASIKLHLDPPSNAVEKKIHKRLESSPTIITALEFLNNTLITQSDITLAFGPYERIWYENNIIEIPYLFIQDIRLGYSNTRIPHKRFSLDEFTGNTLFHVIFHEMAHALVEQYNLPIVGKEEDAADNLADILLIYFFDKGDDIVISAADYFFMNGVHKKRLKKEDYWAEHSTDKQRYYSRICHVYGSNPEKHISLKRRVQFSDERAYRCIRQYAELEKNWLQLLQPALKAAPQNTSG